MSSHQESSEFYNDANISGHSEDDDTTSSSLESSLYSGMRYVTTDSYPSYMIHPSMAYPIHHHNTYSINGNYLPGYASSSSAAPRRHREASAQCPVCMKYLSRKSALQVHMRVHTGQKPFKCRYCSKEFSQAGNRTVHERIHQDVRPYVCGFCYKRFIQKSSLDFHLRTHERKMPVIVPNYIVANHNDH